MIAPHEAANVFGIDFSDFFRAFIVFLGAYFGTKHGTNGNGNGH